MYISTYLASWLAGYLSISLSIYLGQVEALGEGFSLCHEDILLQVRDPTRVKGGKENR